MGEDVFGRQTKIPVRGYLSIETSIWQVHWVPEA